MPPSNEKRKAMDIRSAILAAQRQNACIEDGEFGDIFYPTNTINRIEIYKENGQFVVAAWEPSARDLTKTTWKVSKLKKSDLHGRTLRKPN